MKRTLGIFLMACLLFSMPQTGVAIRYAWWLRISYETETTHIQSISVSDLDPSWTLAEPLSKEAIPPEELTDFEKLYEPDGYSFSKEGDFNADGKRDRAVVGIYKDKSGGVGRFLLILTESQKSKWIKSFVYKSPGNAGFSILREEKGHLTWYFCMDCDIYSFVKWENGRYILAPSQHR